MLLVNDNFEENSGSPQSHPFLCDCCCWQIQECLQKSVKQEKKFKLTAVLNSVVFLCSWVPASLLICVPWFSNTILSQSFPQFLHQSYLFVPFLGNSLLLTLSFKVWIFSRKLKIFITHAVFSPWLLSFIFSCLLKVYVLFQQSQELLDCELNFWILFIPLFLVACFLVGQGIFYEFDVIFYWSLFVKRTLGPNLELLFSVKNLHFLLCEPKNMLIWLWALSKLLVYPEYLRFSKSTQRLIRQRFQVLCICLQNQSDKETKWHCVCLMLTTLPCEVNHIFVCWDGSKSNWPSSKGTNVLLCKV